MSLPRYSKYKDSGVEWLGEVPEGWQASAIKRFCATITDGAHISPETEGGVHPFVSTQDVVGEAIDFDNCLRTSETSFQYMAKNGCCPLVGDVLFSKDGTIGRTVVVREERKFAVASSLIIIRPNKDVLESGFLNYLCQAAIVSSQVESFVKGAGLPRLSIRSLLKVVGCIPPLSQQHVITRFLDHETAKIDALVGEQRRLMELLKEKRRAVISQTVTKGLNPDAPMKPSGIEWLGDVPTHWNYASLTRIASRVVVGIAEAATHAYADDGIPILRSTNIREGKIVGDILRIDPNFAEDRGSKQIGAGDLVTVRTGNAGVTAINPPEFDGCQCFTMLITTLSARYLPEYYCYWMNSISAKCYFHLEGWGTAQVNISVPILKGLPVPMPPLHEQEGIVGYLNAEVRRLDALTLETQRAINLLQERRTALISAAVTGQIDVRGLAQTAAA